MDATETTRLLARYSRSNTQSQLNARLADIMEDAPTMKKLSEAVSDVMGGRIKSSAETIARTETGGAYNAGADMVREDMGVPSKEWVSTLDERTRRTHLAADGQVVPSGGSFDVGAAKLRYPGDPLGPVAEIVSCRCVSVHAELPDNLEDPI